MLHFLKEGDDIRSHDSNVIFPVKKYHIYLTSVSNHAKSQVRAIGIGVKMILHRRLNIFSVVFLPRLKKKSSEKEDNWQSIGGRERPKLVAKGESVTTGT
jgi:hypothetical protein